MYILYVLCVCSVNFNSSSTRTTSTSESYLFLFIYASSRYIHTYVCVLIYIHTSLKTSTKKILFTKTNDTDLYRFNDLWGVLFFIKINRNQLENLIFVVKECSIIFNTFDDKYEISICYLTNYITKLKIIKIQNFHSKQIFKYYLKFFLFCENITFLSFRSIVEKLLKIF